MRIADGGLASVDCGMAIADCELAWAKSIEPRIAIRGVRLRQGKMHCLVLAVLLSVGATAFGQSTSAPKEAEKPRVLDQTALPAPKSKGRMSLEETLAHRRSVRLFTTQSLSLAEIGQLMWAAQGITEPTKGLRTSPSAGATYPLDLYAFTREGVARYRPAGHALEWLNRRDERVAVAGNQDAVKTAPLVVAIVGVPSRVTKRFREPGATRYIHQESGHVAQNLVLQATALGLGGLTIGGGNEGKMKQMLVLPAEQSLLYVIPIGHPDEKPVKAN